MEMHKAIMATDTVLIEPETLTNLTDSLNKEFSRAEAPDIQVHPLGAGGMQIETPVDRLAFYHFQSSPGECSWTTPKGRIVVRLKSFSMEQRTENELFCVELKRKPLQEEIADRVLQAIGNLL